MKIIYLILFLLINTTNYAIQVFPSGIEVSFDAPKKPSRKTMLIQREEDSIEKNLKSYRIIRVINSISNLPKGEFLALVFYDKKSDIIETIKISISEKPNPNHVFFIDRDTGRYFKGMKDIYLVPKKAVSFGLAFIDRKKKVLTTDVFEHPDFEETGHISIETLISIDTSDDTMLQYEVLGDYTKPNIKLGAFRFVR